MICGTSNRKKLVAKLARLLALTLEADLIENSSDPLEEVRNHASSSKPLILTIKTAKVIGEEAKIFGSSSISAMADLVISMPGFVIHKNRFGEC